MRSAEHPVIFGAPVIGEAEIASVSDCLRSGWIGAGTRVKSFEQEFARYKGAPYAAAVSSGTAAIHLALAALGIGAGDEVIAPTMTFCSTIHAIVHTGAQPVLVDCLRTTYNLNPAAIERRITPRTKAIVVVHMCGRCCDMDAILEIARRHNLRVIEDCAHAIESAYHGTPSGLLGDIGCFSFYPTKNITTGDGGMVVTTDKALFQKIKTLSLQGIDTDAWTRYSGGACAYSVLEAGFKYNMTDIAAALGLPQLAEIESRWTQREMLWSLYAAKLQGLPLLLPPPPEPGTRHAYHLYSPLLITEELGVERENVIAALRAENILTGVHFVPVHVHEYYRKRFGFTDADFPEACHVGTHTISLPLTPNLSVGDVADVCRAVARVLRYFAAEKRPAVSTAATLGTPPSGKARKGEGLSARAN